MLGEPGLTGAPQLLPYRCGCSGVCVWQGEGGSGWSEKPSMRPHDTSWHEKPPEASWHDWSLSLCPRGGSCVISLLGSAWSEGSGCRKSLLFLHSIPQGYGQRLYLLIQLAQFQFPVPSPFLKSRQTLPEGLISLAWYVPLR